MPVPGEAHPAFGGSGEGRDDAFSEFGDVDPPVQEEEGEGQQVHWLCRVLVCPFAVVWFIFEAIWKLFSGCMEQLCDQCSAACENDCCCPPCLDWCTRPLCDNCIKPVASGINNYILRPIGHGLAMCGRQIGAFLEAVYKAWLFVWHKVIAILMPPALAMWELVKAVGKGIAWGLEKLLDVFLWVLSKVFEGLEMVWIGIVWVFKQIWRCIEPGYALLMAGLSAFGNALSACVGSIWRALGACMGAIWGCVRPVLAMIGSAFKACYGWIGTFFSFLWQGIKAIGSPILSLVKAVASAIGAAIGAVVSGIKAVVSPVLRAIRDSVSAVVSAIKDSMRAFRS